MDRRVQRTQKLLSEALFSLILEVGYESITIQDIADRANLGRSTFYIHYKDKEDLLLNAMEEGYRKLEAQMDLAEFEFGTLAPLNLVFDYAAENRDLFLVILHGAGKTVAYKQARDYLAHRAHAIMATVITQTSVPLSFMAMYYAGALLSMLIWWLEEDMPYSSEEMVVMLRSLLHRGLAGVLDETPSGMEP